MRSPGNRSIAAAIILLVSAAAGIGGYAADGYLSGRLGGAPVYRPSAVVPRPRPVQLRAGEMLSARAYDVFEDRMYVLDPLSPAVHVLAVGADALSYQFSFGRKGGGPGEFATPTGIAVLQDPVRIAVLEPGRMHTFTATGEYSGTTVTDLPCAMPMPMIAAARRGVFVHGNCMRRGAGTDTMAAVLLWSVDGSSFDLVATEARFTLDGASGNPYGPDQALAEGSGGEHAFGSGVTSCIQRISEQLPRPVGRRACDERAQPYRLVLRESTRRELEAARLRSGVLASALTVPKVDAAYAQLIADDRGVSWLRGYSEDSLVLRRFGEAADLAVLPRHGLIGCRRGTCLFAHSEIAGVTLAFYDRAALGGSR